MIRFAEKDQLEWMVPDFVRALEKEIKVRESHVPIRGQVSTTARQHQQQHKSKDGGISSTSALTLNLQKKKCVYCLSESHTSEACEKVTGYEDRKKLLMSNWKICLWISNGFARSTTDR